MIPDAVVPSRIELSLPELKAIQLELLKSVISICEEHGLKYYVIGGTLLGSIRHRGFIPWDDDIDIALPRQDHDRLQEICRANPPEHCRYVNFEDEWRLHHNISKLVDARTELIEDAAPNRRVRLGVYIDIFPLDGVPAGRAARAIHYGAIAFLKGVMELARLERSPRRPWQKRLLIALVQTLLTDGMQRAAHRYLERLMRRHNYHTSAEVANFAGAWGVRELMPREWFGEGASYSFEGIEVNGPVDYDRYLRRLYGEYMQLPPVEKRKSHHHYTAYRLEQPTESPYVGANGRRS